NWFKSYVGDRLVKDVGCGSGFLLSMMDMIDIKCMGIEPFMDTLDWMDWNMERMDKGKRQIHILCSSVEDNAKLIKGLGDKAVMLFARPCHSNFVENGLKL